MQEDKIFTNLAKIGIYRMPLFYEKFSWRITANLIWCGLLLFFLVLVMRIGGIMEPFFLSIRNWRNIAINGLPHLLISLVMVVIFSKGGYDMSTGAVAGLSGVLFILCVSAGMNLFSAVLTALGISLLIGFINGTIIGLIRSSFLTFFVTFLAMQLIKNLAGLLTGGITLTLAIELPESVIYLTGSCLAAILAVLSLLWMQFPGYGVKVQALHNENKRPLSAAIKEGMHVGLPFVISALVAGFTGIMLSIRIRAVIINSGIHDPINIFAVMIIGGVCLNGRYGNVLGVILAWLLLYTIENLSAVLNLSPLFFVFVKYMMIIAGIVFNYALHMIIEYLYRKKTEIKVSTAAQ